MTSATGGAAFSDLLFKATPPRAPRHLLVRPRLSLEDERFRDRPVTVVQAPAGFGKTSLLAQWRREHIACGAAVAWLLADGRDDLGRFLRSLVLAVRVGCGRPAFGHTLLDVAVARVGELEGVTAWLGEVAQMPLDLVLMVDEAERLPPASFSALAYLAHNTPPNLRVVIAARNEFDAAVADLIAYGAGLCVGPEMLRFRVEETIALVRNRFGARVDADTCARLHELTDGWPLGLQLALAAMEQGAEPRAAVDALSTGSGDQAERLVGGLLSQLTSDDAVFLTRIATLDLLHPELCRAVAGFADAPERLARLIRDTPLFGAGEGSEWCRLHALARDALRARLAQLPADEQAELHVRAMGWLVDHEMLEEAARHAYAANQRDAAIDLAERCLYDALMQGQQGAVLDWLKRLPEAELDRSPRLTLAIAWALALSERWDEAERWIDRIVAQPQVDAVLRYECALIASGAASFADEPDRRLALFAPWIESPPLAEPRLAQIHANRLSWLAIVQGDPALARRHQQRVPRGNFGKGFEYAVRWGEFFVAWSYLWEGQVLLAMEVLQSALEIAEAELGRRHPLVCMLASLLASALYERDRLDEAAALLANRMDVLERLGSPDALLLAYLTAARLAAAQGVERRALDMLEGLFAAGMARRAPRLCIASLAEQIRMHAGFFRSETCRALARRIDEMLAGGDLPQGPLWRRRVEVLQAMAHANSAIAAQDWSAALEALARAAALADAMRLGRLRIEIMSLRALALERNGDKGRALLQEAVNLAQTFGLVRIFADAHPAIADWERSLAKEGAGGIDAGRAVSVARVQRVPAQQGPASPRVVPSMVLTAKERQVLELLARNLSNKEIGQAMGLSDQTVKWHLKHLFAKLDAATRKHVVRRAQLLGLLEGVE